MALSMEIDEQKLTGLDLGNPRVHSCSGLIHGSGFVSKSVMFLLPGMCITSIKDFSAQSLMKWYHISKAYHKCTRG